MITSQSTVAEIIQTTKATISGSNKTDSKLATFLRQKGEIKLPIGNIKKEGKSLIIENNIPIKLETEFTDESLDDALQSDLVKLSLENIAKVKFNVIEKKIESLTDRELQIFGMMAQGIKNKRIAEQLNISPKTLDIHRTNIIRKMDDNDSKDKVTMATISLYYWLKKIHESMK